jgi:hypothetical protein
MKLKDEPLITITSSTKEEEKNMSKLIAFAAIQGGYKVVAQVEGELEKALQDL